VNFGYYTDLRGIQFHDDNTAWIQAMPVGKYKHPIYGDIEFNEERAQRFADNVNKGVVGTALDIDYDHKAYSGKAAGWVQQAENRGAAGLFLKVDFTPDAVKAIKNHEYRYFSPEFQDAWTHPKTGKEHKDVLRGGGLTNRPFLKDILPVNLSELTFEMNPRKQQEAGVTPKEIRDSLGLAETATDEEVRAKLTELQKLQTPPTPPVPPTPPAPTNAPPVQLDESNPTIKVLMDMIKAQGEQITAMATQVKLNDVDRKLADSDKGKVVMAPAAKDAFRKMLLGEDVPAQAEAFLKLMAEGTALVETGERGGGDPSKLGETDAEKAWDEAIAKLMEKDKLSYGDAATAVARDNPKLFGDYREASTAFKA